MHHILVAGKPGSGNHLVANHCRRIEGVTVSMSHATGSLEADWLPQVERADAIIVPFRLDEAARMASAKRRAGGFSLIPTYHTLHAERIVAACGLMPDRVHVVCFELILASQGVELDVLLLQMGLDPHPWPAGADMSDNSLGRVMTSQELAAYHQQEKKA